MFTHSSYANHEKVFMFNGLGGRLRGMIAIHDTTLGPAVGGCRFAKYDNPNDALRDVLRLSHGMTYKCAAADLPLGGGKSVILSNTWDGKDRKELFECFGEYVNQLTGQYYTAVDFGSTLGDMRAVSRTSEYVCGVATPILESTARGAFNAILAVAEFNGWDLTQKSVAIQGVGKTGYALARLLHKVGVGQLFISDITIDDDMPNLGQTMATELNATVVHSSEILSTECDILAPCALGGILTSGVIAQLQCKAICGIANNQLADDDLANALKTKDILYIPDFIANAGGVIAAANYVTKQDHMREIDNIKHRVLSILETGAVTGKTPLHVAKSRVKAKLNLAKAI